MVGCTGNTIYKIYLCVNNVAKTIVVTTITSLLFDQESQPILINNL